MTKVSNQLLGGTVKQIGNETPSIGQSMLRASPPGQLYKYGKRIHLTFQTRRNINNND